MIALSARAEQGIREAGERAWPNECCGFVLGRLEGGEKRADLVLAVESLKERQESQIINSDDYGLPAEAELAAWAAPWFPEYHRGGAARKTGVLSFVLAGRGNEEVGKYLNAKGIAVRAGRHYAQPVLRFFGLEGAVRPSLAFYNTFGEIDQLAAALKELVL